MFLFLLFVFCKLCTYILQRPKVYTPQAPNPPRNKKQQSRSLLYQPAFNSSTGGNLILSCRTGALLFKYGFKTQRNTQKTPRCITTAALSAHKYFAVFARARGAQHWPNCKVLRRYLSIKVTRRLLLAVAVG